MHISASTNTNPNATFKDSADYGTFYFAFGGQPASQLRLRFEIGMNYETLKLGIRYENGDRTGSFLKKLSEAIWAPVLFLPKRIDRCCYLVISFR